MVIYPTNCLTTEIGRNKNYVIETCKIKKRKFSLRLLRQAASSGKKALSTCTVERLSYGMPATTVALTWFLESESCSVLAVYSDTSLPFSLKGTELASSYRYLAS